MDLHVNSLRCYCYVVVSFLTWKLTTHERNNPSPFSQTLRVTWFGELGGEPGQPWPRVRSMYVKVLCDHVTSSQPLTSQLPLCGTGLLSQFCCYCYCCCCCLLPTKEGVNAFARVRLSVCLLGRLLKNVCMDLNEIFRVDRWDMNQLINFWARSAL